MGILVGISVGFAVGVIVEGVLVGVSVVVIGYEVVGVLVVGVFDGKTVGLVVSSGKKGSFTRVGDIVGGESDSTACGC